MEKIKSLTYKTTKDITPDTEAPIAKLPFNSIEESDRLQKNEITYVFRVWLRFEALDRTEVSDAYLSERERSLSPLNAHL